MTCEIPDPALARSPEEIVSYAVLKGYLAPIGRFRIDRKTMSEQTEEIREFDKKYGRKDFSYPDSPPFIKDGKLDRYGQLTNYAIGLTIKLNFSGEGAESLGITVNASLEEYPKLKNEVVALAWRSHKSNKFALKDKNPKWLLRFLPLCSLEEETTVDTSIELGETPPEIELWLPGNRTWPKKDLRGIVIAQALSESSKGLAEAVNRWARIWKEEKRSLPAEAVYALQIGSVFFK